MLFVKIENNEVTKVWDTQPPAGEGGWKSAVEVKPACDHNCECYEGHTFDLTKDPVEIVYTKRQFSVDERKDQIAGKYRQTMEQAVRAETDKILNGGDFDMSVVLSAKSAYETKMAALAGASSHADLDVIQE